jgi:histone acetyltransferase (RNA polymerase elongator complex component)
MPFVIPIFIPHQGCPQQCLFCNQYSITGDGDRWVTGAQVTATIREWLARPRRRPSESVQVAFYGGSFTCLPRARQEELLAAVQPFLQSQSMDRDSASPCLPGPVSLTPEKDEGRPAQVGCIRLSTRPDCVDNEVCSFLLSHGVGIVELGVQSLDDRVLQASRRGHNADHCRRAVALLQAAGMEVGVQLMPGLPLETTGSFLRTVREVVALAPAFVRLYPVLVVEHAGLALMYRRGEYQPLSMNRALALTRRAREILTAAGIRVVRIGLQPSISLERELVAGPYHPAFGELVAARIWFRKIRPLLAGCPVGKRVTLRISPRDLSAVMGMKRSNMQRFAQMGLADRLEIKTDPKIQRGTLVYAVN